MWNPFKVSDNLANHQHAEFLSIVVVINKMSKQATRTLQSLSPLCQRNIRRDQYEVIVIENDSEDPLPAKFVKNLPENFQYTLIETPQQSPVYAMNLGLQKAKGSVIGAMTDGTRMVSPGLLQRALYASRTHPTSVVTTMSWRLGYDAQNEAHAQGYGAEYEDQLLASIKWPKDGYRLFSISVPEQACADAWTASMHGTNAIFLRRPTWDLLGGYCEEFTSSEAGVANQDLFKRACELADAQHVLISDEATFRQSRGCGAKSVSAQQQQQREYQRIRSKAYMAPAQHERVLYGSVREQTIHHYRSALLSPLRECVDHSGKVLKYSPPSAENPARGIPIPVNKSPTKPDEAAPAYTQAAVELVQSLFSQQRYQEACDAGRLILAKLGHGKCSSIEQILSSCSSVWIDASDAPPGRRSRYLSAKGRAHQVLGELDEAEKLYLEALELSVFNNEVRANLSKIRMPGDSYFARLDELHQLLKPKIYLEIGVCTGDSIQLATPPTLAYGIDPQPKLLGKYTADTRLFPILSDEFFARNRTETLVSSPVDFGFIDGSHEYMQVVRDFWNLERLCSSSSVIAFHDTLPLDQHSSQKNLVPDFWTGDVWKILPFLLKERPDLTVITVRSPPSGLTLVSGLHPTHSMTLDQALSRASAYDALSYNDYIRDWSAQIQTLENTPEALKQYILGLPSS